MGNILHRIKANLYENVLTEDANDYLARVSSERTLSITDICSSAVNRGGADVIIAIKRSPEPKKAPETAESFGGFDLIAC